MNVISALWLPGLTAASVSSIEDIAILGYSDCYFMFANIHEKKKQVTSHRVNLYKQQKPVLHKHVPRSRLSQVEDTVYKINSSL